MSDKVDLTCPLPWPETPHPESIPAELVSFLQSGRPVEAKVKPIGAAASALIDELSKVVLQGEAGRGSRKRPRGAAERAKVRAATGVIIGSILRAWTKGRPVVINYAKDRLGEVCGGRVAARLVIEELHSASLISHVAWKRWANKAGAGLFGGEPSRLWPTAALLQRATKCGLSPSNVAAEFRSTWPTKVPFVREPVKAKTIRPVENKPAQDLPPAVLGAGLAAVAAEVENWNAFAATVAVTGCRPPRWFRSFGPSVLLGGRWWAAGAANYQTMPEPDRLAIRIGGEAVAEVDVKAAALSILHGLLGLSMPEGDPYAIEGAERAAVKAWIVATIGLGKPMQRWRPDAAEELHTVNPRQLGDLICRRYPFMRDPTAAVAGPAGLAALAPYAPPERLLVHRLMAIEAAAITGAMRALRERYGALSLPVHDSLIVPAPRAEEAAAALVAEFQTVAGAAVTVTIDGPARSLQRGVVNV